MTAPADPRTRYALDSQAELRGAFLDVFVDVCPDIFEDLWSDRDAAAWAARHGLTDPWLVDIARATLDTAGAGRLSTFFVDVPATFGWTRETNAAGLERPARPAMPAPGEPGGLARFLEREQKHRERVSQWQGAKLGRRLQVTPAHLAWTARRLAGARWSQIADAVGANDDRFIRRKVAVVASALGLTL